MNGIPMTMEEMTSARVGEAITLATVMTIFGIVIMAVIAYKFLFSTGGKATLPGGWKFEWAGASGS